MKKAWFIIILFSLWSCSSDDSSSSNMVNNAGAFIENFDDLTNYETLWEDASQNNSPINHGLASGNLKILTRANTQDRVKLKTKRNDFGLGIYTWRVFAGERTIGDQNSIGAFLYLDDNHELDFEIGSGTLELRNSLNAQPDDLIVYCTSQNFPFISTPFLITHNDWYDLKIDISIDSSSASYIVKWYVNDNLLQSQLLEYGFEKEFAVYCSLENLAFMGDQLPTQDYVTLFDSFKFELN